MNQLDLLLGAVAADAAAEKAYGMTVSLHPRTLDDELAMLRAFERVLGDARPQMMDEGETGESDVFRCWRVGEGRVDLFHCRYRDVPNFDGFSYGPIEELKTGRLGAGVYNEDGRCIAEVEGDSLLELHGNADMAITTIQSEGGPSEGELERIADRVGVEWWRRV